MKLPMEKLTNKEEEVMKVLWRLKKAFVKEILAQVEGDKPHYNTLSTLVRQLEEKKYVDHEAFGHTHRYYPLISKEEYRAKFINSTISDYYENSYKSLILCQGRKNFGRRAKGNNSKYRKE